MLEPDVIALLESDAVLILGTVDPSGVPQATHVWGLEVVRRDPEEVRLLYSVGDARTDANLHATGRIAATVTDVVTLASAQVKGRVTGFGAATDDDRARVERQFAEVARKIHETDGTPMVVVERFRPGPLSAVRFTVEEVYDQTPGPVAGRRLAPDPEPR